MPTMYFIDDFSDFHFCFVTDFTMSLTSRYQVGAALVSSLQTALFRVQ